METSAEAPLGFRVEKDRLELWNAVQKIVFERKSGERSLHFHTYVRGKGRWLPFLDGDNALVSGRNFDLLPHTFSLSHGGSRLLALFHGVKRGATGIDGERLDYPYDAIVELYEGSPWTRFWITIRPREPIRLSFEDGFEPELVLSSSLPLNDVVAIEQPTTAQYGVPGRRGNDLPATYLWSGERGAELVLYFDMTPMTWMSPENMRRFMDYYCGYRTTNDQTWIGLCGKSHSGSVFPEGRSVFSFWVYERYNPNRPSGWKALGTLIDRCLLLLDRLPIRASRPRNATGWMDFAGRCVEDLLSEHCWEDLNGIVGCKPYVDWTSSAWGSGYRKVVEYISTVDVLWPWLLYLRIHPTERQRRHVARMTSDLERFYDDRTQVINNTWDGKLMRPPEVWYFFENLIKTGFIALLERSEEVRRVFLGACKGAMMLAENTGHRFPLFFDAEKKVPKGEWSNYGAAGLYAYAMLIAYELTSNASYLKEAMDAVDRMHAQPLDKLTHEPQQLSFGMLASTLLHDITEERRYLEFAKDFLHEELRMFYWYDESCIPVAKHYRTWGTVQACSGIAYPAFKENIESILPWTLAFKRWQPPKQIFRLINMQRLHNFYYFSPCLEGADYAPLSPCKYIPYENLQMLESKEPVGAIGKEIYGTGEVIWCYLMFEALGRADDPEVMVLNLDLLDFASLKEFPPPDRSFIAYNPTGERRSFLLHVEYLNKGRYKLDVEGLMVLREGDRPWTDGDLKGGVPLSLGPDAVARVRVRPITKAG